MEGCLAICQPPSSTLLYEGTLRFPQFPTPPAKGDVLQIARIAGLMAAKQTANLIPLCHPVGLDTVSLQFTLSGDAVLVRGTASVHGKTGVEMEAMTAVSVAALTIYDMCKAIDRGMRITCVQLEEKSGGKSGSFMRKDQTS